MKLKKVSSCFNYAMSVAGILFLVHSNVQAGTMGPAECCTPGKLYLGVFGGGGSATKIDLSQYGTALFTEDEGGPLAVNSFGVSGHNDVGIVGGQVGYQWPNLSLNLFTPALSITPAVELEGYYLGKGSYSGRIHNDAAGFLPEHDFLVDYPITSGAFLGNAVINFNPECLPRWHPFLGGGIGGAVVSIKDAEALQIAPPEFGVNHYNSNVDDAISAFAAQIKAGLKFDVGSMVKIFAEYRGLYIADTNFTFGSTMYPAHAVTTNWLVKLDSQYYNLGAVGLQFSFN